MLKPWKAILLIAICFSSSLTITQTTIAQSPSTIWEIERMNVDIEVNEDASILVREEIATEFFPGTPRHGIFRDIPFRYTDAFGNQQRIIVDIESVYLNGDEVPYEVSKTGRYIRAKIGDPDAFLAPGQHQYTITYSVDRAMLYFDDRDELYWNVTGDGWEVPVPEFSGSVTLPDGTEVLGVSCYTGAYGSTDQDCTIEESTNDAIFTGAVFAGNGIGTIAIGFEKGLIYEPTSWERFMWLIQDNWPVVIPILWSIFVIWFWFRHGRDPKMKTIIAEYEAPDNLLPTYAGMYTRTGVTSHDFAVMIVTLASKGYLDIVVDKHRGKRVPEKKLHFVKKRNSEGLDRAHASLYDLLFDGRDEVSLAEFKKHGAEKIEKRVKPQLQKMMTDSGIFAKGSRRNAVLFIFAGFVLLVMGIFLGGTLFGSLLVVVSTTSAIVTVIFGALMPKRTPEGNEHVRKILGFKLYLETADRYRARFEEDRHLFTEMLPYAIAFKLTGKWARVFRDLDVEQPDWLQANGFQYATLAVLNDLGSISTIVATASAPSSSGSSGGGFSGGGFGGGGGGSW